MIDLEKMITEYLKDGYSELFARQECVRILC